VCVKDATAISPGRGEEREARATITNSIESPSENYFSVGQTEPVCFLNELSEAWPRGKGLRETENRAENRIECMCCVVELAADILCVMLQLVAA
jgi:hypothetical protein